jgi:hypothetical protein
MAPALASDPVSQADTPMTDTNDDTVPSVPVDSADAQMVCEIVPTFVVQTSGVTCHMYLPFFSFLFFYSKLMLIFFRNLEPPRHPRLHGKTPLVYNTVY